MRAARGPDHPPGPGGHGFSFVRAAALVVVALALVIYLVSLGAPAPVKPTASSSPTTTVAASPPTSTPPTSSPTTTAPPASTSGASASVKVLVANASQTNGAAATFSKKLATAGWGTLTPVTALTTESTSSVYYATGQQSAAQAIATSLGIPATSIAPIATSAVPVPSATEANADVVVVIGDNLAS